MRKDVVGCEDYEFDEDLNIYNKKTGKMLKPQKSKTGYMYVTLYKEKKPKKYRLHRLIAITFIDNPEQKPQINHINGIKTDNRIENLEWVTASENLTHAYKTGLIIGIRGDNHGATKIKDSEISEIFAMRANGYTLQKIADKYFCYPQQISRILNGKSRK